MNSQFGLMHVWTQGDIVTRTVFLILVGMSILSWIVIIVKALDLARVRKLSKQVESFWHSSDISDAMSKLDEGRNPFREIAIEGREATAHHRVTKAQLHDSLDVSEWVSRALQNAMDTAIGRLQGGLAILASVGSTAPFVGLFGTVWGIYHALMGIGAAGQVSIDQVAGPIGEALIMTALGLAVAIPAVLGYNALIRGNKGVTTALRRFANDLHAYYVTGARIASNNKVSHISSIKNNNVRNNAA